MVNKEHENYIKEIADKINNSKEIEINNRKVTKSDVEKLGDYEFISVMHPKGFKINIRRWYILETFYGIPVLMFKDKYFVYDEIFGKHDIEWTASECAEYVNGLLGY